MRLLRRGASCVLLALLVLPALPARPVGASAAVTAAFFDGEPGSMFGTQAQFSSVTFGGFRGPGGLMFTVSNSTYSYQIWFAPPAGSPLVPGTYDDAQRLDFRAAGHPGLELFGEGTGCNQVFGRFIVDDATYDSGGRPLSFSVRFEHHCEGFAAALFGELSYQSSAPYRTRSLSAESMAFTTANASQTFSIQDDGPGSLTPGDFSLSGPIAASFSITANSCTTALTAGTSCSIGVTYDGSLTGNATLTFSDELAPIGPPGEVATAGTGRDISLTGSGSPPPTTTTTMPPPPPTTTTTTAPPNRSRVSISTTRIAFGGQRVGTYGNGRVFTITNSGRLPVQLTRLAFAGPDPFDYFGATDCSANSRPIALAPHASCRATLYFSPLQRGTRTSGIVVGDNSGFPSQTVALSGTGTEGYFIAGAHGEVEVFGDAVSHGDATGIQLKAPMISLATTPNGAGYWLLAQDGGIFSYGNAGFHGSTGAMRLNKPIVAMSATRDGGGYRLVGSDGGIFAFGDARFYGSTGAMTLNKPVDGMAATVDDRGYWLVASDGGIFAFGDAGFYGSAGGSHLTSPVMQITPTPAGRGYWILTADGHLYAYGDAHSYGSAVGQQTIGMAATPDGRGYWEVTRSGRVFGFGDAASFGDISNLGVSDVVGIAATAPPLPPDLLGFAIPSARPAASPRVFALPTIPSQDGGRQRGRLTSTG